MNTSLGKKVLVTSSGLTLYRNKTETAGRVKCTGACATVWPPLTLPVGATHATAGAGITQSALGKAKRADGKWQVTYKGQPLYTFAQDQAAGQTNGQGIKDVGTWMAATVGTGATNAAPSTTSSSSSPPSSSSEGSSKSGGYGY